MAVLNILIVGVGGQGTLLAGKVIGAAALKAGHDVKISEVHGMAQRGGSVVTHVRVGVNEQIMSPLVEIGSADVIISFEELEAARWKSYLKKDGILIVNTQQIDPMPVVTGAEKYPENISRKLKDTYKNVILIDALKAAEACGNTKTVNMVLLGVAAAYTPIEEKAWIDALNESVPAKFREVNEKAIKSGINYSKF